jgi:integrase
VKVSHLHSNLSASWRTHDLRHTGNTFAAASGVGLRDLMARMGHDSERAAMVYQGQDFRLPGPREHA